MPIFRPEEMILKSGNPDLARYQWSRLESLLDPSLFQNSPLLSLLGNSRILADYLISCPNLAIDMFQSPYLHRKKERRVLIEELRALFQKDFDGTSAQAKKILRQFKYREMIRIAARDLSQTASFEEVGEELSSLASACMELAYEAALQILGRDRETHLPFCILGLGKLGGKDLNFSSDIDVIYLYDHPDKTELRNQKTHFEFLTSVSELLTQIMQERTEDGIVFRTDLDLRPEGKSGSLVNSLDALMTYYEVSGAAWERAALIKARPVGGSEALGQEFIRQIQPFVYRRLIDSSAIIDLKKMKEKINKELPRSKGKGYHVKLGVGGIREIEFFVTAFQLVYGGKEVRLRESNTLKTLTQLREIGLVPAEDCDRLRDAYIFLRRVENRLQMVEEQQTHTLPVDTRELQALARRMGFSEVTPFLTALEEKTRFVAGCFEKLAASS